MPRGYFITFEGLDGSGKTTQLQLLAATLKQTGYTVTTTRQPGGTALGDQIRTLLVDSRSNQSCGEIAPAAELALMFADRAQSIAEVLLPSLDRGHVVLCDRFTDSSEAYQGAGRQLGSDLVRGLHQRLCGGLQPDLTLLLLPPLAVSLGRARRRNLRHILASGTDENRFEREPNEFYERVHEAYLAIARRDPQRVLLIEETGSIDAMKIRIAGAVMERLAANVVQA